MPFGTGSRHIKKIADDYANIGPSVVIKDEISAKERSAPRDRGRRPRVRQGDGRGTGCCRPRAHKERFPVDGSGLQRYSARLNADEIKTPLRIEAWCIFDNTGSGPAAGNALDLRAIAK